jgi:hypothetical protein
MGTGGATRGLVAASLAYGAARAARDAERARWLAAHAWMDGQGIGSEGRAVLPAGPWPPTALATLIRAIGGRAHASAPASVARLAAEPRAATLGGARLRRGSRRNGAPGGWRLEPEAGTPPASGPAAPAPFLPAA